jgi:hypothetical protein
VALLVRNLEDDVRYASTDEFEAMLSVCGAVDTERMNRDAMDRAIANSSKLRTPTNINPYSISPKKPSAKPAKVVDKRGGGRGGDRVADSKRLRSPERDKPGKAPKKEKKVHIAPDDIDFGANVCFPFLQRAFKDPTPGVVGCTRVPCNMGHPTIPARLTAAEAAQLTRLVQKADATRRDFFVAEIDRRHELFKTG